MTPKEVGDYVNKHEENKTSFHGKRDRLCELIVEKGMNYRIDFSDFDIAEKVETVDSTGERRWRPGTLFRKDVFERKFSKAERKKMSFQHEDIPNEDTGAMESWVRVFDEEDGVIRFEKYVDNQAKHTKVVNNGELKLDKDELTNTFKAVHNQKFQNKAHAKGLTLAQLPGHNKRKATDDDTPANGDHPAKKLKKCDTDESSCSSSTSSEAPLLQASASATSVKKKAAKGKASAKAKASGANSTKSLDVDDDMPQSKADATFLQQCVVKLNAAAELYDHIKGIKALKDYDDARVVTSIRALEGRMTKINNCNFLKMKAEYQEKLTVLRGFQDLVKAVKKFEGQSRIRKQSTANRAAMASAFDTFLKDCNESFSFPWCIRKHQLFLVVSVVHSADEPFAELASKKEELKEEFGADETKWRAVMLLAAIEYVEIVLENAKELEWSTSKLMKKLYDLGNQIKEVCELSETFEWVIKMQVIANPEACTIEDLKSALTWLSQKSNANRAVLALLNGAAGEGMIKSVKVIVESGVKEAKLQEHIQGHVDSSKEALDNAHKLLEEAGDDEEAQYNVIKKQPFQQDIRGALGCVKFCNSTWKESTEGMRKLVKASIMKIHSSIEFWLKRDALLLRAALFSVPVIFDTVEETPTSDDELASRNDLEWPKLLSEFLGAFAKLALDVLEKPAPSEIIALYGVNQVVEHFVNGAMEKVKCRQFSEAERSLPLKLKAMKHLQKAVDLANEFMKEPEASETLKELGDLKTSAEKFVKSILDSIGETMSVIGKSEDQLLRSLLGSESDKLAFWPAAFSSANFYDKVSALPVDEAVFEAAIGLAQVRNEQLQIVRIQCLAHCDRAQRAMLAFCLAMSRLKSVSSTEFKDLEFESEAVKQHHDADLKVGALLSFLESLDTKQRADLQDDLQLSDLMAGAKTQITKATNTLTERWESMAKMLRRELATYHPAEKEWRRFVISHQDKEKMSEMIKSEKLLEVGKYVSKVKQYTSKIDDHCSASMNKEIRAWYKQAGPSEDKKKTGGAVDLVVEAVVQGKLALAVATACKIAYFKGPKTKDVFFSMFMLPKQTI